MCDNNNSVVTSCTLDYAYFGIVTETGACPGDKREDREKANEEDTEGVCKCSEDQF